MSEAVIVICIRYLFSGIRIIITSNLSNSTYPNIQFIFHKEIPHKLSNNNIQQKNIILNKSRRISVKSRKICIPLIDKTEIKLAQLSSGRTRKDTFFNAIRHHDSLRHKTIMQLITLFFDIPATSIAIRP